MTARAVFVDRDGVVIEAVVRDGVPVPQPPDEQARIIPGAAEAIAALRSAGFRVVIVTNQPDLARGLIRREQVDARNTWLREQIPQIDEVRVCPHDDADGCPCRKPRPGLIVAPGADGPWALDRCYVVGDRWRDMEAGRAAGCTTVFVDRGYGESHGVRFDHAVTDLWEASRWILERETGR